MKRYNISFIIGLRCANILLSSNPVLGFEQEFDPRNSLERYWVKIGSMIFFIQ